MGARPVSSSRRLHILGSMWALVSSSDSILISLPLYLNSNTSLSMYLFCNSYNNSLFESYMCVLSVNASVLTPHMNSG
jgi:hypothetical protein